MALVGAQVHRHRVEGLGQLAEFIARGHRDFAVEVALPERHRGLGDGLDRLQQ
jgi:hypothetical protein